VLRGHLGTPARGERGSDAEALHDLFADEEVMGGLGREPVSAVEDVRAMIATPMDSRRRTVVWRHPSPL
jgi:hypothetical protein